MVKMIVTDLDNTLLRSDKTLSPFTVDTLIACKARGIPLVYATMRPERAARHIEPHHLPDYIISNNGALITQGERILRELTIENGTANRLLSQLADLSKLIGVTADAGHTLHVDRPELLHLPGWQTTLANFGEPFVDVCYKITAGTADHTTLRRMAESYPELQLVLSAAEDWHHFLPKGATKHQALAHLLHQLHVPPANVAAFGDDSADAPMLALCGHGVAVANAVPETKAAAAHHTLSCDEDGVAHWLRRHVLSQQ